MNFDIEKGKYPFNVGKYFINKYEVLVVNDAYLEEIHECFDHYTNIHVVNVYTGEFVKLDYYEIIYSNDKKELTHTGNKETVINYLKQRGNMENLNKLFNKPTKVNLLKKMIKGDIHG